jgi:(5-formylfuran-3-yl)methyl phosphate synthase
VRLLVSVRDPAEAVAAVGGGADLVDAKDPMQGALGALDPRGVEAVAAVLPESMSFSVALGDAGSATQVREQIGELRCGARRAAVYIKLGFGAAADARDARALLAAAVESARWHPARPAVIAVAYADTGDSPETVLALAIGAGASGVLVDTAGKNGGSLFQHATPERLRRWVGRAHQHGLLAALAGRLDLPDIPAAVATGSDIIGIRGAACVGGRTGRLSAELVRGFRQRLATSVAEAEPERAKHQTAPDAANTAMRPTGETAIA